MKLAYVFSGGGARGAFQVGYLQRTDVPLPDVVLGCSAGALNAAGYAYLGPARLLDEWLAIRWIGSLYDLCTRPINSGGVLSPAGIREILERCMVGKQPKIPLEVNYSDLIDDCTKYGDDIQAVIASTSIPGLVKPVDERYVDGGLYENAPVSRAITKHGATEVHVISCFPLSPVPGVQPEFLTLPWVIYRSLESALRKILVRDIELARHAYPEAKIYVVEPPVDWRMDVMGFNPEAIRDGIEVGKKAELRRI